MVLFTHRFELLHHIHISNVDFRKRNRTVATNYKFKLAERFQKGVGKTLSFCINCLSSSVTYFRDRTVQHLRRCLIELLYDGGDHSSNDSEVSICNFREMRRIFGTLRFQLTYERFLVRWMLPRPPMRIGLTIFPRNPFSNFLTDLPD